MHLVPHQGVTHVNAARSGRPILKDLSNADSWHWFCGYWWMGGWTRKIELLILGSIAVATILSLVMRLLDGSMDGDLLYRP